MTTDKFKNLRIFRERIATLESLSDAYKAKALAGIDKILSDEEYAERVEDNYASDEFLWQFSWERVGESSSFWNPIFDTLFFENKHIIEE